ncbi:hypothetical protein LCGC14_0431340 [marine sediment metagenome]|uniref:Uncharacterized protein n=1 Tax=marine sediment metagenome TaxID=412755 RepID=A0A0F9SUA1_9ZZZZ
MNKMIVRGCGTSKQIFGSLKRLAKEFGHLTLAEVEKGNKCRFLGIMRRLRNG